MKSTGVVRKLDSLGRIVIPIEIRRNFNLEEDDPVEIFTENKSIVLRKYQPGCFKCGELKGLSRIEGFDIDVCPCCLKRLKNAVTIKMSIKGVK